MDVKNYLTVFFTWCNLALALHLLDFSIRYRKNGIRAFIPFSYFAFSVLALSLVSVLALMPALKKYHMLTVSILNGVTFFSYAFFNYFILLALRIPAVRRKRIVPVVLIIPILAGIISLSNPFTHLFLKSVRHLADGFPVFERTPLLSGFKLASVFILAGLFIAVLRNPVIKFQKMVTVHILMVCFMLIPMTTEVAASFFPRTAGMGLAYFFVTVAALVIKQSYWGYLPFVRSAALEFSKLIYMVFDTFGQCTDMNRKGSEFLKMYGIDQSRGESDFQALLNVTGVSVQALMGGKNEEFQLAAHNNELHYYHTYCFTVRKIYPFSANAIGIIITDTTRFKRQQDLLSELANWDSLTKIHNRRYFYEYMKQLQTAGSVLMIDIDLFKNINDTYGHLAGDEVLVQIAARCKKDLRANDIICRYGGEEFLMLFPGSDPGKLHAIAERIRVSIESEKFAVTGSRKRIPVTVSIGGYNFTADQTADADFAVGQADAAMYQAKANGRNQVYIIS